MSDEVVYVIDDDEGVRRALCRLVASVALRAEGFPSAEAFLEKPLPEQPSWLVLDLNLGNGLSGLALQAELRDRQYIVPILFISGTTNVRSSVAAMKAGAFDFLEKPIDQEVFRLSEEQARRWFGDQAAALITSWKGRTAS